MKGGICQSPIPSYSHVFHDRHGAPFLRQKPCDLVVVHNPEARDKRSEREKKTEKVFNLEHEKCIARHRYRSQIPLATRRRYHRRLICSDDRKGRRTGSSTVNYT